MLKAVVADLESVDEALRPFYAERDGRHYLTVEPVEGVALEDVTGLKSALSAERRKVAEVEASRQTTESARQALEASLVRFRGIDPAKARAALDQIGSGSVPPDVERLVADRAESMRAAIAEAAGLEARTARAELDTVKGTLTKRDAQLQRLARDNAMRVELDKVRPLPDAIDALMLMAGQHVVMAEVDGELTAQVVDRKGEPRLDSQGHPFTIAALMNEMREQRSALFLPTKDIAGVGTTPQRGRSVGRTHDNPFAPATRNLTRQVLLEKNNPELASRLRAEAGMR